MNESSTSKFLAGLFLFAALTGCTSVMDVKRGTPLDRSEMWVLLPFSDYGETPQAGERAEEMATALLRVRWDLELSRYPVTVQEWRYRNGSEGEAAVGLSLRVINIKTGRADWLATGSRSGIGAQTVSGVAETLLRNMLSQIRMK